MKYAKSIFLSVVVLVTIGTFYIQSILATENHETFKFETISGNEQELEEVMMLVEYGNNEIQQNFEVTFEGTAKQDNQTVFQRMQTNYNTFHRYDPIVEKLISEYPKFMRGKYYLDYTRFYEDEDSVVYVEDKHIEILDKDTGEITDFQLDFPRDVSSGYIYDIQMTGDKLKVFTAHSREDSGNDLHVFTVDVESQSLVSDQIIQYSPVVENESDGVSHILPANNNFSIKPEKYFNTIAEYISYHGENSESKVLVYNIENGESKEIDISSKLPTSFSTSEVSDSTLYMLRFGDVFSYDLNNDTWGEMVSFDIPDTNNFWNIQLMNGKAYYSYDEGDDNYLFIGDVSTGETLYHGKLSIENQKESQDGFDYSILNFYEVDEVR